MFAVNQIIFPVLLFVVYFSLAIQFLPQPATVTISARPKVIEPQSNPAEAIHPEISSTNANSDAAISRDWLETQSIVNLKAIAAELCITPIGDKRSKLTWIDAIASTTPKNTVLAVNLCYA
ncbi:hypothetical protein [Chamaesiphon polymorphus]|uniref:hypothetical protein n=1 Tax=Chamaesiphon polymorphus TaxID=2107691 RepID=UPI0015E678CD|nr:hypothetical protein [Chamaesiphon polymorphus]